MLGLLALIVVVAVIIYFLGFLSLPAPFPRIILAVGVIIVIVACLKVLLGVDILASMRGALH